MRHESWEASQATFVWTHFLENRSAQQWDADRHLSLPDKWPEETSSNFSWACFAAALCWSPRLRWLDYAKTDGFSDLCCPSSMSCEDTSNAWSVLTRFLRILLDSGCHLHVQHCHKTGVLEVLVAVLSNRPCIGHALSELCVATGIENKRTLRIVRHSLRTSASY